MTSKRQMSGRVERTSANVPAGPSEAANFANDSLALSPASSSISIASRTNITVARVAQIEALLKPLHRELLSIVARLNVASGKQLRVLIYPDSDTGARQARRDLARLTEMRVIARLDRRVGGVRAGSDGYVYALDIVGQRLARPGRRRYRPPWTPGPHHLAHALAVSQLYVDLMGAKIDQGCVAAFDAEPSAWRTYAGPGGSRVTLKPDAFAVLETAEFEDSFFIEVDRATESLSRIALKARSYIRYWQSGREQASSDVFPRVLWVAPHERRAEQISDSLAGLQPEHWRLFAITTARNAVGFMTGIDTSITPREEVNP